MAEDKKSFLLYTDLIHTIDKMPNDKAGELFKHILSYVNDLNPITDDLIIQLTFEPIKQQLKRDLAKYEVVKIDKSNGGKLGNLKRWHKDLHDKVINNELNINEALYIANNRKASHTDSMQSVPIGQIAVNVNDSVNVNDNVNAINKKESDKELISKFTHWFNKMYLDVKGKETKYKTMTPTDINNYKKLKAVYEREDFVKVFKCMLQNPWVKEHNKGTIDHFLRNDNFVKYLNTDLEENVKPKFKAAWQQ